MAQPANLLDPTAPAVDAQEIAALAQNEGHKSSAVRDVAKALECRLERALTGSPGPNEAAVAPDWMGWVAAAGLISLAASRFSKWRRIRPRFPWGRWSRQGVNETGKSWRRMSLPKPHLRPGVPLLSAR